MEAAQPCAAGGCEILRRAAPPVRAGGGHEFGESIMMIAPYLDLYLESGGVGRCLDGLVNALQIRRQGNGRGQRNGSAANCRARHEQSVRIGVTAGILDLDMAGIPDGVSMATRHEVLLVSGYGCGAELNGTHPRQRQPLGERRRLQGEAQPNPAAEMRRQLQADDSEVRRALADE